MSTRFLFKKSKWFGTEEDKIEADIFISSNPTYSRQIPMHPVQGKSQVGDTIIKDPISISIEGLISETPIGGIIVNPLNMIGRKNKVALLYSKLVELYNDTSTKTLITIVDGDQRYENMSLKTLSLPKDASDGDGFRFSATFLEIIIVDKVFVDIVDIGTGSKSDMANKVDKGSVTSGATKSRSVLDSALGGLFGESNLNKFSGFFK